MLRINDLDSFTSKIKIITITTYPAAKNVIITIYFIIIRSAAAENDSLINRTPSFKIVIPVKKKLITFTKKTFFVREIFSIETFREHDIRLIYVVVINEYRPSHIDVKNVIVFASLKIKKIYNARHQFIFFKVKDLVNLRLYKNYKVFIITSKKIRS